VVGQENMGVIEETGEAVTSIGHGDRIPKAKEVGAIPVDFSKGGEEKMKAVDCLIDAVGCQARDSGSMLALVAYPSKEPRR
jgi:hypothetical protein